MEYGKAFLCGGALCVLGQLLIDKTALTPAKILVLYVTAGVALSGLLLPNRQMSLKIRWKAPGIGFCLILFCSSYVHKIFRQVQIAFFSGAVIEPDQSKLDFLVTGGVKSGALIFYKHLFDMIRHAAYKLKESLLSCCLVISYRSLHQMSGAV